jgi:hypothetical protein
MPQAILLAKESPKGTGWRIERINRAMTNITGPRGWVRVVQSRHDNASQRILSPINGEAKNEVSEFLSKSQRRHFKPLRLKDS